MPKTPKTLNFNDFMGNPFGFYVLIAIEPIASLKNSKSGVLPSNPTSLLIITPKSARAELHQLHE
jgi:hypothetical protein